jgi:predicted Fe-Mo cluster-binding NifX family protein
MKIAVCAKSQGMESIADDRFGRAEYYVIFDTNSLVAETVENTAKNESAGAGGSAVRLLSKSNVEVVLVPELGPKAVDAVNGFEIKAYRYADRKTVRETIEAYQAGQLQQIETSTTKSHSGLRRV